jgi:hypothetical protein
VQCRLDRLGHEPIECRDRGCPCPALADREWALLKRGGPPAAFTGVEPPAPLEPTFRRGFVESVTIREEDWQRAMDGICRKYPLRDLTLEVGPLPTDTGNVVHVNDRLSAVHVLDRIAVQTSGRPLAIFDPSNPAKSLTARHGPFKGRRLALVTAVWLPPGYNPA